jgi:hypothetical protein
MKMIVGELRDMNILLKPNAKPVKQRPYRINPTSKDKVKEYIERMLEDVIIEPIKESKWISPMVVQDKKTGGIRICVDMRKLFYILFTDEVLENVGGQEDYSFTDRFSRYH